MNPVDPVQRQLVAYNARDLVRFLAEYAEDVQLFGPPATEPLISGKAAMGKHYADKRFSLPNLHATVVNRMVVGNTVVDHEHVLGIQDEMVEAIAVYRVENGLIRTVWFY